MVAVVVEVSAVAVGKPEGSRRSEFDFPIVDKERTWKILEATARIARVHDCSPARISVAWLLDKPVVASMITGAKRLDQLQDPAQRDGLRPSRTRN
jgi:aryl-alcohol dehydrogenase-like predicted oxidoreductase